MERVTATILRERVARLQQLGIDITISWSYDMPMCYSKNESVDLSPRLPVTQMAIWLDGFKAALKLTGKL